MSMTSDFEWNITTEFYNFLWGRWNVMQAKEILIAKPREVVEYDLTQLEGYVKRPKKDGQFSAGHVIDWDKIDTGTVDTLFPLIGATLNEGPWIIDGWHRMAKGFEMGQSIFPVALLDKEESDLIRVA